MRPEGAVAVTGMSMNTPLSDTPEGTLKALLAGRSAITRWRSFDPAPGYSLIGADLGDYDPGPRAAALQAALPGPRARRLADLLADAPHTARLGLLLAADALIDAGLGDADLSGLAVVVAGHNLHPGRELHHFQRAAAGEAAPLDVLPDSSLLVALAALTGSRGPLYSVGGACASGNLALQAARRELLRHGARHVLVLGAVPETPVPMLHGFAMLGALSIASFNDEPARASRPWDQQREGFVPAQGGAAFVLTPDAPRPRAWLRGVGVCSDANHLTAPDEHGQARAIARALQAGGMTAADVDYVSAHATSTPVGDLVELRALRHALGPYADRVKINATKSMTGHTFGAAALVEAAAGILQMNAGRLHGTINLDAPDPAVDLDVCAAGPVDWPVRAFLNDAFGFGGINAVSLFSRGDG